MNQPLSPTDARKLLRRILDGGIVTYAQPHALDRLKERSISILDCENVMRAGVVEEPELVEGCWRYRVRSRKIVVVVEFLSDDEVLILTAWRIK
ncbi:hypothetical protein C2E25_11160 [Geothermobacter hydrogeniphilus]|uniref:DUF4258 domain-containing protein n=1 Tax=Geothermobacter hydrogeniphilus TaxID=1969733 RepID=A0A2K2H8W0_9BACT|nr:DUF4258 domain-containing protein [Geothermobacter hydrogeniphilus]PNU19746.1 hypothetical protein C2E25_11160 [Geothermobacter hydrogeniphilus]